MVHRTIQKHDAQLEISYNKSGLIYAYRDCLIQTQNNVILCVCVCVTSFFLKTCLSTVILYDLNNRHSKKGRKGNGEVIY
jgi:hypothetical protein